MNDGPTLLHLPRLCKREGVSRYMVQKLIEEGRLEFVLLGTRVYIPAGAWERFIERETAKCRNATPVPDSAGSRSAARSISSTTSDAARSSAARALRTAKKLKTRSS